MTAPLSLILDHRVVDRLLSVNCHVGRDYAMSPLGLVIHVTEGDRASVISWFNNPKAEASAHYLVCIDGTIIRFVEDVNTAWHAGRRNNVTAPLVLEHPGVNPNAYLIGIEHEGSGTSELTPPQRASSIALQRWLCARWAIPIDRTHIIGHREIFSLKTCPGAIDVDRLVADVAADPLWVGADVPTPDVRESLQAEAWQPTTVYSTQLGEWLLVTRFGGDDDWSFVTESQLRAIAGTRAGTPLSHMPRERRA